MRLVVALLGVRHSVLSSAIVTTSPKTKPPTCAKNATPPPFADADVHRGCRDHPALCRARRALAAAAEERWQAHLGSDDLGETPEVVLYWPECAEREFGD
jgi:hypothetical protein